MREIDVVPPRHQRIDVVAADPALHLGKARRDFVRLAGAQREQVARQRLERRLRRQIGQVRPRRARNAPCCRRPAWRRPRARSRACCRSAASAPPQELLPSCRRWWRAKRSRRRPGTTGRAASVARLRSSSTMPGSTRQRRPATSRSSMRLRCFEQSITSELLTVCPACEDPPPRASTVTPSSRASTIARSASSVVLGVTTPSGMIW